MKNMFFTLLEHIHGHHMGITNNRCQKNGKIPVFVYFYIKSTTSIHNIKQKRNAWWRMATLLNNVSGQVDWQVTASPLSPTLEQWGLYILLYSPNTFFQHRARWLTSLGTRLSNHGNGVRLPSNDAIFSNSGLLFSPIKYSFTCCGLAKSCIPPQ